MRDEAESECGWEFVGINIRVRHSVNTYPHLACLTLKVKESTPLLVVRCRQFDPVSRGRSTRANNPGDDRKSKQAQEDGGNARSSLDRRVIERREG